LLVHGILFTELRRFVEAEQGSVAWVNVLEGAGLSGRTYLASRSYPDLEAQALFESAAAFLKRPLVSLFEAVGEFMASDLLTIYEPLLDPQWRTLDLIENTEQTIHTVVRRRDPGARPPELRCVRTGPDEVILTYASTRRMCGVAKGIARGVARSYGETVEIAEDQCMLRGAGSCVIVIRRLPTPAHGA
jgi:hypothetical protein